jgi:hypothetical protein
MSQGERMYSSSSTFDSLFWLIDGNTHETIHYLSSIAKSDTPKGEATMVGKGLIWAVAEAPGILRSQRRSPSFMANVGSHNSQSVLLQGTLSVIPIILCFVSCLSIQSKLLALSFLLGSAAVYAHGLDEWNEPTPRVRRVGFIEGTKFTRAPRPLSRRQRENIASRQTQEIIRLIDKKTGIKTQPWGSSDQNRTVDLRSMRARLKRASSIKSMTTNSLGRRCSVETITNNQYSGLNALFRKDEPFWKNKIRNDRGSSSFTVSKSRFRSRASQAAESRDDNALQNPGYEESDAVGCGRMESCLPVDKPGFGPFALIDECGNPEEIPSVIEALSFCTTSGTSPE